MAEIDTANKQLVGVRDGNIVILNPIHAMTKEEALVHAAYLVALADDLDDFEAILEAVLNA